MINYVPFCYPRYVPIPDPTLTLAFQPLKSKGFPRRSPSPPCHRHLVLHVTRLLTKTGTEYGIWKGSRHLCVLRAVTNIPIPGFTMIDCTRAGLNVGGVCKLFATDEREGGAINVERV